MLSNELCVLTVSVVPFAHFRSCIGCLSLLWSSFRIKNAPASLPFHPVWPPARPCTYVTLFYNAYLGGRSVGTQRRRSQCRSGALLDLRLLQMRSEIFCSSVALCPQIDGVYSFRQASLIAHAVINKQSKQANKLLRQLASHFAYRAQSPYLACLKNCSRSERMAAFFILKQIDLSDMTSSSLERLCRVRALSTNMSDEK